MSIRRLRALFPECCGLHRRRLFPVPDIRCECKLATIVLAASVTRADFSLSLRFGSNVSCRRICDQNILLTKAHWSCQARRGRMFFQQQRNYIPEISIPSEPSEAYKASLSSVTGIRLPINKPTGKPDVSALTNSATACALPWFPAPA